ncbi:hypothetical protein [Candidatus Berkiella aquae]|uniref:Uncharacterized protein n=1 Tax=Candidatus Berkiella aquae TaxID=295108 RepID=A0A0Q9Z2A5_9GAMM|nr:hypothetical protein [Candidatus Berkiella aquae]MCS5711942.1 hypothetical protein [Candidatus Berkiella aquae]
MPLLRTRHEPMTVPGAVTGGLSGAAVGAAGGGLTENIAWRPGFAAINMAGQAIAAEQ